MNRVRIERRSALNVIVVTVFIIAESNHELANVLSLMIYIYWHYCSELWS